MFSKYAVDVSFTGLLCIVLWGVLCVSSYCKLQLQYIYGAQGEEECQILLENEFLRPFSGYLEDIKTDSEELGNKEEAEELRSFLSLQSKEFRNATEQIFKLNYCWARLKKEFDGERRGEEEKRYDEMTEGKDNFLDLAVRGQDTLTMLEERLEEVDKSIVGTRSEPMIIALQPAPTVVLL
ncbi:hypothetical protein AB6A40_001840 [Gnathostoma spinigerum]|uniref:Uncharacterized protein n=1 Tax=Gnathostoma spinigerum TaxID=75299 RepID=A0ABD6ECN8_9BILA